MLFVNGKGPLFVRCYGTKWPLCVDAPLKPIYSFILSALEGWDTLMTREFFPNQFESPIYDILSTSNVLGLYETFMRILFGIQFIYQ